MPDVFVPLDTLQYTELYRKISRANLIVNTSTKYINANRKKLASKYADFDAFNAAYSVPEKLLEELFAKATEKDLKPKDDAEQQATADQLAFTLKALVAYDLWSRNEYLRIINERDDIVNRALEILKED